MVKSPSWLAVELSPGAGAAEEWWLPDLCQMAHLAAHGCQHIWDMQPVGLDLPRRWKSAPRPGCIHPGCNFQLWLQFL